MYERELKVNGKTRLCMSGHVAEVIEELTCFLITEQMVEGDPPTLDWDNFCSSI